MVSCSVVGHRLTLEAIWQRSNFIGMHQRIFSGEVTLAPSVDTPLPLPDQGQVANETETAIQVVIWSR